MSTTPNPDTHCTSCHEPLSIYGHCWQHEYPPMDPAQDKPTATSVLRHAKELLGRVALGEALTAKEVLQWHEDFGAIQPPASQPAGCNGQRSICLCISSP